MAKTKSTFYCTNCGYESPKWLGKCPSCQQWNTFNEEVVHTGSAQNKTPWADTEPAPRKPQPINKVTADANKRIETKDQEFNRVLGGGIVPGSIILIGGEPGIGKSTLLLQIGLTLNNKKILYISGEESEPQIKMRADRMGLNGNNVEDFFLLTETVTTGIFTHIKSLQPDLIIVDSIQTLQSPLVDALPGSISQLKQTAGELFRYAKETMIPVVLIGHITKDGSIAGPKLLEHMVDTVLQFEGDRHLVYRLLRTMKNRFGSTSELGIYEMTGRGLREVANPSEILISKNNRDLNGVAIGATLEGNRPLLIEIQSLVSPATYGTPQRSCTGYDIRRLNMLLAVLEKRAGFRSGNQDVFLNIAGGLRIEDPAIDLSVCVALVSSIKEITIPHNICFTAEIGLGGELRGVNRVDARIVEAEKLGFKQIIIAEHGSMDESKERKIKVLRMDQLKNVFNHLFD